MRLTNKKRLNYVAVFPTDYEPERSYPIVIALPPADQNLMMVSCGITQNWMYEGVSSGWIVISPAAPLGQLFHPKTDYLMMEFLARVTTLYQPEGGKFHLAGFGDGGSYAFHLALNRPEWFHSLMVLPGSPPAEADITPLRHLAVSMYVEAEDTAQVKPMRKTAANLMQLGGYVRFEIIPEEGHIIESLINGVTLFDQLDHVRAETKLEAVW